MLGVHMRTGWPESPQVLRFDMRHHAFPFFFFLLTWRIGT